MSLKLHPRVHRDVSAIVRYYDFHSDRAGDRFLAEVEAAFAAISANPERFHFIAPGYRRANVKSFPYHLLFEVKHHQVRVVVVRHHRRHPDYGLRRRWPEDA